MITPEQIKNLKEGDPILIHGTFVKTHADGDIQYESPYTGPDDKISNTYRSTIPSCVSLPESQTVEITLTPTPKYDPCRLFKEGDKVRPVQRYGRYPDDGAPVNVICEVVEDERINGTVAILARKNGRSVRFRVTALYLELVTPVEELCPYSVRHNEVHAAYSIYGPYGLSAVNYFYGDRYPYSKHSAEAAAYAECDRLNAAHRKEQK